MGCCFSNDSDEKEEVVRIRTSSRIPPMTKTDRYGTLSNEEEETEFDPKEIKQSASNKEEQEKKPPQSPKRIFGKLPLRSPKSPSTPDVPEDPFTSSRKRKLKRGYATRGDPKKSPSNKFAQGSPVVQRIKATQDQNTNSSLNDSKVTMHDIHEASGPIGTTTPGSRDPRTTNGYTSIDHRVDHSPDAAMISTMAEQDEKLQSLSPAENIISISDASNSIGTENHNQSQEWNSMKKVKTKKSTPKKIASKLGKFVPGKKKKKDK